MKLLYSVLLLCAAIPGLWAQSSPNVVSTRVETVPPIAQFIVDGQTYTGSQTFLWTEGTNHTISALPTQRVDTDETVLTVGPWTDNLGGAIAGNPITVVAKPGVSDYQAAVSVSYRVRFQYQSCDTAVGGTLAGTLIAGGARLTCDTTVYYPKGTGLELAAIPSPHFAFVDWGSNIPQRSAAHTTVVVNAPLIISPHFVYAKRIIFQANPPGLTIYVDRSSIPTAFPGNNPPVFDFAPGTQIMLGAPEVQTDQFSNRWAFDSWSFGGGNNVLYTVPSDVSADTTITAKFVPSAGISIYSDPRGLPITIDGSSSFAYSNFNWGVGTSHTITAPATTHDTNGRIYTFKGWNNGAAATQTIQVTQAMVNAGTQIVAQYALLSRVSLQTNPPGIKITVDGSNCDNPCVLDRDNGSTAQVSVPASVTVDANTKLVFDGWTDNKSAARSLTLSGPDAVTLTAHYTNYYRVTAASDPANAVNFTFNPTSADGYYQDGVYLTVTTTPKPGYKFIRFDGDLQGNSTSAGTNVSSPLSFTVILIKIPFVAPAGIRNAAGDTPDGTISPGSLITIFGQNLADDSILGPASPLAQMLGGTTVRLNDRILFLQFVSPAQINAVMPQDLPDGKYSLSISTTGNPDTPASVTVARNAPGIFEKGFKDQNYVVAFHADGTLITPDSPARRKETITIWGTGFGPYDKRVPDGFATPATPVYTLADTVEVIIGGVSIQPQTTVAAPGMIGVSKTTVQLTSDLPNDTAPTIRVRVNQKDSNSSVLPLQSGDDGSTSN